MADKIQNNFYLIKEGIKVKNKKTKKVDEVILNFDELNKIFLFKLINNKKIVFVLGVLDTSENGRLLDTHIENFDSNIAKFSLNYLSKNMRNLGVEFQILQLEK